MIKSFLVKYYLKLTNFTLSFLRQIFYSQNLTPSKILIFRTGSMGDSIAAMPALNLIKQQFPNAVLILLTNTGRKNLISLGNLVAEDFFDEIIDYQGQKITQIFGQLKRLQADLVIQLPQNKAKFKNLLRDLLFFRILGIKSGFGWSKYDVPFFRQHQDNNREFIRESERLLRIVSSNLNINEYPLINYPFEVNELDQNYALAISNSLKPAKDYVCIVVGAKRPQNRWPVEYFDEVIHFIHLNFDLNILIIGGPEDAEIVEQLKYKDYCKDYTGKLKPLQSGLIMSKSKLVITNDTGPMHLAYAFNAKVIALFSSRDFKTIWYPPEGNIVNRTESISCKLCLTETCKNNICMQMIKPSLVINQISELLRKSTT